MAGKSRDARYVPALAGLLLLTLGAAAWLLYTTVGTSGGGEGGVANIVYTQSASVQARQALSGDQQAWKSLEASGEALRGVRTTNLTEAAKDDLAAARKSVGELLEVRGEAQALKRVLGRLGELVPGFADGVYKLQGELSIQRQPIVIAQLERLQLLSDSVLNLARQLPAGNADQTQNLVNKEMELQQIVRALQAGDPQLGMVAIAETGTEQAIASLARRATQISAAVREAIQASERVQPGRVAAAQLDKLSSGFELGDVDAGAGSASGFDSIEMLRVFAMLGARLFLVIVILLIWLRTSGRSSEAQLLKEQSEADQQAILNLLDELDSLADGDLTVQATVNESITGAIADSVNYAVEALRDLVATINQGAILLEDATHQTEASARNLESASEAQARQVTDASSAVRQMAASIDEVSGNAERSADVARHSVDIAHKGGDAVRRTIEGMNTIRETIQDTSKRIKRLGESSQEIGDIVELINDIADQTNILALNASIQASMAGEAGRGFAVVADEVQRLAERSASATKQIEIPVSTIQSDTNEAVVSMERSTTDVVGGALLAENAGAALEEIEQVSNQIAMLVQNISGSAKDQTQVTKAVLQNVEQLQEISGETGSSAANTSKYISKLSELASQLREAASGFTLPAESGDAAQPESAAEAAESVMADVPLEDEELAKQGAA